MQNLFHALWLNFVCGTGKILGAEDPGGSKGLLKWKGVMFAPDDGIDKTEKEGKAGKDTTDSAVANKDFEQGTEVEFSFIESRPSIIDHSVTMQVD